MRSSHQPRSSSKCCCWVWRCSRCISRRFSSNSFCLSPLACLSSWFILRNARNFSIRSGSGLAHSGSGVVSALQSRLPKAPKASARPHLALARTVTRRTQHYYTRQRGTFPCESTSRNCAPLSALRNRQSEFRNCTPLSAVRFAASSFFLLICYFRLA